MRLAAGLVERGLHGIEQGTATKGLGPVAPALVEQVGDQGVADDAAREGVAVGHVFPFAAEVPVVGDVVVVEDHGHGQVREHAPHGAQALAEVFDGAGLARVAPGVLLAQAGRGRQVQALPGQGRPDQQVHGQHLAQGDEVVVRVVGGEDGLLHAFEHQVDQALALGGAGQQLLAAVVGVGVREQVAGAAHLAAVGAGNGFFAQAQALHEAVDAAQHGAGDVVAIDLVAAEHEGGGPLDVVAGGVAQQFLHMRVGARQAVAAIGVVRFAAGAVQQRAHRGRKAQAGCVPAGVAERGVVERGPGAVGVSELEAVAGPDAGGEIGVEFEFDQHDGQVLARAQGVHGGGVGGGLAAVGQQGHAQSGGGVAAGQPPGDAAGLHAAKNGAGENGRQMVRSSFGHSCALWRACVKRAAFRLPGARSAPARGAARPPPARRARRGCGRPPRPWAPVAPGHARHPAPAGATARCIA